MQPDIEALRESLRQEILASPELAGHDLISLALPSIRMLIQRELSDRIGLGETRVGGRPDVPPGFEWPRWRPSERIVERSATDTVPSGPLPLSFIAQIDLSALPLVDDTLPRSGWLYFFYDRYCEPWGFDPEDREGCRVFFANCDRLELTRIAPPPDANPEHASAFCRVETGLEMTLPDELPQIEYGAAFEAFWKLRSHLIEPRGLNHHRLLGHPQIIQNPMELECQLASNGIYCGGSSPGNQEQMDALRAGAVDWRLLLQIDSDEEGPGWMWGDVGCIYFWIKVQDLRTLRFDDVWLILQCC